MGDSQVPITAGSGTNIDTRTNAAGEHRQVVVIGNDGELVSTVAAIGTKTGLDVNLAGSAGGVAAVTGTLTGSGSAVTASVVLSGNATISIYGGTFTNLPIIFEATADGTNWFSIDASQADGTGINIATILPNGTAVRAWNVITPGYSSIRVRQTAAATAQTVNPTVYIAQGPFLYDPSPTVGPIDGQKATYTSLLNSTAVASAVTTSVDIWNFANPTAGTRTIRILRMWWQITLATAGALPQIQLVRRSALNTGGTAVTQTAAQHDTRNGAATAEVRLYTAAPTVGASAGVVKQWRGSTTATVVAAGNVPAAVEWTWGNRPGQGLTLLPGQSLGLMSATVFATAPTLTGDIEWTEE